MARFVGSGRWVKPVDPVNAQHWGLASGREALRCRLRGVHRLSEGENWQTNRNYQKDRLVHFESPPGKVYDRNPPGVNFPLSIPIENSGLSSIPYRRDEDGNVHYQLAQAHEKTGQSTLAKQAPNDRLAIIRSAAKLDIHRNASQTTPCYQTAC